MALLYALHLTIEVLGVEASRARLGHGIDLVIVGDNDYYSHRVDVRTLLLTQGKAPTLATLHALEPFAEQQCTLRDVHKTGLGSSAAMTTSFMAGLLLHLGVVNQDEQRNLTLASLGLVHNAAQLAHCAAQGKVGSGFDVSSSVWGSQLYRRFDPTLIQDVMRDEVGVRILAKGTTPTASPSGPIRLLPVLDPRNPRWHPAPTESKGLPTAVEGMMALAHASSGSDSVARPAPLQLPPGIRMCLADVDAGSNTRTLVGQVRTFQKEKPEWGTSEYLHSLAAFPSDWRCKPIVCRWPTGVACGACTE